MKLGSGAVNALRFHFFPINLLKYQMLIYYAEKYLKVKTNKQPNEWA